jgi:hypothetical protein
MVFWKLRSCVRDNWLLSEVYPEIIFVTRTIAVQVCCIATRMDVAQN